MSQEDIGKYLPDQQCANVCISLYACENLKDNLKQKYCYTYGTFAIQQCIDRCTENKHKTSTMWPTMVNLYGNIRPNIQPDKKYCDTMVKCYDNDPPNIQPNQKISKIKLN